jgi:hypothetical protein
VCSACSEVPEYGSRLESDDVAPQSLSSVDARHPTRRPWWAGRRSGVRAAGGSSRGAVAIAVLLAAASARARLVPCRQPADAAQIADAIDRIRRSVDPCGESPQVVEVVDRLERCTKARYEICTDGTTSRNLLDPHGEDEPGTIIWNPKLRSELERGCDGDPTRPVMRDPVASLLHEIVHAADDCEGRNPAQHELEAVRVENIYRRAAGLCQRSAYGDEPLGVTTQKVCTPEHCECSVPSAPRASTAQRETPRGATDRQAADSLPEPRPAPRQIGADPGLDGTGARSPD